MPAGSGSRVPATSLFPWALRALENGTVYMAPAPEGILKNAVGAGDSMVAGFLAGWEQRRDPVHAFRMAVAGGSASAFSDFLATRQEIEALYTRLEVSCTVP